ncbi:hypothetical protein CC78DRAFT_576929 [Lojkania enalia]|uniref:DUF7580 domain-containing protein n=1 Tax=Lojkania enalia TaxID=147567 RepID=A0A9P4KIZ4_9PLEO|nr:hypothetical protein CC78DRAFT_576929 [Didymosphaeria enalia]
MSGLEIGGVVLGSLPFIITAMEHYAQGIKTAKRFWRYKSEMTMVIRQLKTEQSIFINTLEKLLTGIVRVDHMSDFIKNPWGEAWHNPEVEAKLKLRLRDSYDVYIENIRGMETASKNIMEKLALGPDGKAQFSDTSKFKYEYKRLKFSLSRSDYEEQLSNLKGFNLALSQLTTQSLDLESTRVGAKGRACPNFKAFQDYARSLYSTLLSGWSCRCQGHAVNLRLESRSQMWEKDDLLEQMPFRVIFCYTSDAQPNYWKEAEIRYITENPNRNSSSPHNHNVIPTPEVKRQVRFERLDVQVQRKNAASSVVTTSEIVEAQLSPLPDPTPSQIQDLCKAIAKMQQPQRDLCLGYLIDELKRKHGIYSLEPPIPDQQQWAAYSLKDVLSHDPKIKRRLTQQDKLRVAVDLASSVLQLYKTPWLDEALEKDDVFFIHRPGAAPASIYEHPFVCRKFTTLQNVDTSQSGQKRWARYKVIRNQTLFTLGILLIELWYGKPIEELRTPSDLDCEGTPGVEWCTAERLVETEIEFEAGPKYSDAVRRCIRCDFDRKDMSLDNESFQQAVYDGVVALLEKTLQQFISLD